MRQAAPLKSRCVGKGWLLLAIATNYAAKGFKLVAERWFAATDMALDRAVWHLGLPRGNGQPKERQHDSRTK